VRIRSVAARLVLLSLVAGTALAAPAELEVKSSSPSARVGDHVPVRVAARGGEDLMWGELKVAVEAAGPWAVVKGPAEVAGARPPVWELVLAPMELGELQLPAVAASVRTADGEARQIAAAELPSIDVVSVLPAEEEAQPAPLRDPLGVSGFPWEWVLPLAMPILGLALALAWWSRRRLQRDGLTAVPVLAPFDELAELLDRLDRRIGREPGEAICDRLAGGLRHYLERTTAEPAEEMTSFELRLLARGQEWPDVVQRGIHSVMGIADRVRFGRLAADDGELRRAIETSRDIGRGLEDHLRVGDEEVDDMEAAG
jgi:hypothetical protein